MLKLAALYVALAFSTAACATAGHNVVAERDDDRASIRFEVHKADTTAVFPAALAPRVPTVDRLAPAIRGTLGDSATAMVDLCVSPAGKVTKATLLDSSSFSDFDAALLRDIEGWKFAAMPGPATLQTCERATVTYRPY